LPLDEENKHIRARIVEEELARWQPSSLSPDDVHNPQRRGKDGFTYEISQPDGNDVVTIHYDTNHDVRVTALISNGLGYIYRHFDHSCLAGTDQLSLNCAELSKGQYIIYINVDGNQYAEKVNVK
jgi:hypothetical protein